MYSGSPAAIVNGSIQETKLWARTDWIARTPAEYVAKAVEWSERTKELADARKTLRQELLDSPVVKGYVEAVEQAYKGAWKEWCER